MSIFRNGRTNATVVSGSDLNDYEKLVKIGTEAAVPTDVKSSFGSLNSQIAT